MPDEYASTGTGGYNTATTTVPRSPSPLKADSGETDRPDVPAPGYETMRAARARCRALWRGNDAIRDGGTDFLPKFPIETDTAYAVRKGLAALHNGFVRTVKAVVGLLMQVEPVLGDDMSARLKALWEDIDRAGTHGAVFTSKLLTEGLLDGLGGILVEYPRVDNPAAISADDESRLKLRPYWIPVHADDLYCALYQTIDGVRTLVLLIIREVVEERKGQFGVHHVERYRVYSRDGATITCEVWRKDAGEAQARRDGTAITLRNVDGIPFSPFIPGEPIGSNILEVKPTLLDLADLNIEHHQVKTGIRYLEETACIPQQVRVGAQPDKDGNYPTILRGPNAVIEVPKMEGVQKPVYWDSPDVTVLEPAAKSLDKIEQAMGAAGLAFLAPDTRAAETAEAKRIDASAQNATIRTVGRALQDCLELAFDFTAQYVKETAGSVTINTEFEDTTIDAALLTALGTIRANGDLSRETLWDIMERRGVLPEGFDKDKEQRRVLSENALPEPTSPTDGTDPAGTNTDTADRTIEVTDAAGNVVRRGRVMRARATDQSSANGTIP